MNSLTLTCALLGAALMANAGTADASAGGRSGFSGDPADSGGTTCTVCHAPDGAATPGLGIIGPTTMDAGTTANFFVLMLGGPAQTAGVNITSGENAGSFEPFADDLQLLNGELTHTAPKPLNDGIVGFPFRYTAPNYSGEVTLFAAGNSSDGGLDLLGDGIGTITLDIVIENGFEPPPEPPEPATGELEAFVFASGLSRPVVIENAGDERLFVAEQAGRIRIIEPDGSVLSEPFLDIENRVDDGASEMGLLGLAFHPDYANNGYFYVYYTYDPGPGLDRTRVSRFTVSEGDANLADANSELILLEFEQRFSNHNGGDIHFGPFGYLHIASGDGGAGGDPFDFSQTTSSLLGKMLRIDVDTPAAAGNSPDCDLTGAANYSIPPSNAFNDGSGGAGCDEIFALGLRNPWRFTFDSETGGMWIADVGQGSFEEVNYLPPGSAGGANLGWRCYEGDAPFNLENCNRVYLPPVHTYSHATSGCSITGGRVYRGSRTPLLQGQYFFTDFCQPSIRALSGPLSTSTQRIVIPTGQLSAISTFGEDVAGELYIAELNTGTIYQLDAMLTPGDVDGDGDVDFIDIVIIWYLRGTEANGDRDRADVDGNGLIESADLMAAGQNCTRPQCAY
ncbi:MAG: sorbosone dehydrogenase family protein [Halioglobus sp.]